MSTFAEITKTRKPIRTFVLPPSAWADDYDKKPNGEVAVGLRLLSERDIQAIKRSAVGYAVQLYANDDGQAIDTTAQVEAYNDACLRWLVGRSCCDPNDMDASYFEFEEETVRRCLTSEGVRFIFNQYDRMRAEESPLCKEISEEETLELFRRLQSGEMDGLADKRQKRLSRLLFAVLDELRQSDPDGEAISDTDPVLAA